MDKNGYCRICEGYALGGLVPGSELRVTGYERDALGEWLRVPGYGFRVVWVELWSDWFKVQRSKFKVVRAVLWGYLKRVGKDLDP
jgi:hypothetical protein